MGLPEKFESLQSVTVSQNVPKITHRFSLKFLNFLLSKRCEALCNVTTQYVVKIYVVFKLHCIVNSGEAKSGNGQKICLF